MSAHCRLPRKKSKHHENRKKIWHKKGSFPSTPRPYQRTSTIQLDLKIKIKNSSKTNTAGRRPPTPVCMYIHPSLDRMQGSPRRSIAKLLLIYAMPMHTVQATDNFAMAINNTVFEHKPALAPALLYLTLNTPDFASFTIYSYE